MSNMFMDFLNGKKAGRRADDRPGGRRVDPVTGHPIERPMESPYVTARREWNERYGSYIARARTWQLVALAAMALSAILGLCLVKIASQSRVQPFIVEVNKLGEAVGVRMADAAAGMPDEKITRYQLANFITNARSVTPDPIVQKRWLDSVYAVSTPSASNFLNEFYRKSDPFQRGRTNMVAVEITTPPLPLSKTSWQVEWTETSRGMNGLVEGTTRWQAVIAISFFPGTTPQQIIANPTGIVIDTINWTQKL
jgi:type IV secretory pathway TrbF-like protein